MGLEASLVSTFWDITNWALQSINAGIWNAVLKPTEDGRFETTSGFPSEYLKDVIFGRAPNLDVLNNLPVEVGGGPEGVNSAQGHPNREGVMFLTPLILLIIFIIFTIVLMIINCCCCCSGRKDVSFGGSSKLNSNAII